MANNGGIKLDGQLYMRKNGTLYIQYGKNGWFKKELGSLKGTRVYKDVMDSYGTKKGALIRKKVAMAVMKSITYKK